MEQLGSRVLLRTTRCCETETHKFDFQTGQIRPVRPQFDHFVLFYFFLGGEVPGLLDAARGRKGAVLPCVRAAGAGQLQCPGGEEWALPHSSQAGVPRAIPALAWRVALGASDAGLEECCITTDEESDLGIDDGRGWRGRFSASIRKLLGAAV